jgi:cell surface protein SprA
MKKYISSTTVNSAFSRNNERSYLNNSRDAQSNKISEKYSPLISINSTILKKLQTSFSLSKSRDIKKEVTGSTLNHTIDEKMDTRTQLRYRLSSSTGIFGLKLKSDIDMAIEVTTSNSARYKKIGNGAIEPEGGQQKNEPSLISSTDAWGVSPNVQYSFSRNFKGGAKIDIQNSKDMTNKIHKVREVSVWGELTF